MTDLREGRAPPPRFIQPALPARFLLEDDEGSRDGPFIRAMAIKEPDGAVVFYEDGALPMRLGVVQQQGCVLWLHPAGRVRIVALPTEP